MNSSMHLFFGGRVRNPRSHEFANLEPVHMVWLFSDYESALDAWRSNAQRTVDDAEMKYMIVPVHDLLEPTLGATPSVDLTAT